MQMQIAAVLKSDQIIQRIQNSGAENSHIVMKRLEKQRSQTVDIARI